MALLDLRLYIQDLWESFLVIESLQESWVYHHYFLTLQHFNSYLLIRKVPRYVPVSDLKQYSFN